MTTINLANASIYDNNVNNPTDGEALRADLNTVIAQLNATTDGTFTFTSTKTFNAIPVLPSADPTTANQAARKAYVDAVTIGFGRSSIAGLTLSNNATDADNDVDIAAGIAKDGADAVNITLASGLTKRTDTAWSPGTNQGGMDAGAKPNDGTLHVWLIRRSDTGDVDVLFSISATAPTMPSVAWDARRRIGAVLTDGSGNILRFTQFGDLFVRTSVAVDISTTIGTTEATHTITVPSGVIVLAHVNYVAFNAGGAFSVFVSSKLHTNTAPTATGPGVYAPTVPGGAAFGQFDRVLTNTLGQIRSRSSAGSTNFALFTLGWEDFRGRFD